MGVLLSAYGSCGGVEPAVGLAMWLWALGTQARVCTPPDCAAAEGGDALLATGVMTAGGWR